MFAWFKIHKPIAISRNTLRKLISRQCGDQDFVPLDMSYILVPDLKWLIRNTPVFSKHRRDCNHRACRIMANLQDYCIGMVIIETDNPIIDHCVNIVCTEDYEILLYDASSHEISQPQNHKIKRMWL